MNTEQFKKMISETVRTELKKMVPVMVKEVMATMLMEVAVNRQETAIRGNSHKAQALRESSYMQDMSEFDEYPTMPSKIQPMGGGIDRARMAEMMGYGEYHPKNQLIVSSAHTESGTPIPIDPTELPDHVVHALTRNYSDVMKALEKRKHGG